MKKIKTTLKHIDGQTDVKAVCWFTDNEIECEYRFEGMTYGRTLNMAEAIQAGIVKCGHENVQPLLGFDNVITGEQCEACGKILKP